MADISCDVTLGRIGDATSTMGKEVFGQDDLELSGYWRWILVVEATTSSTEGAEAGAEAGAQTGEASASADGTGEGGWMGSRGLGGHI